jgi:hypothetical protein
LLAGLRRITGRNGQRTTQWASKVAAAGALCGQLIAFSHKFVAPISTIGLDFLVLTRV